MRFNSIAMACQQCGTVSMVKPSHAAKGAGKFCSRACMSAFRADQSTQVCQQCSATFRSTPGRIQKGYGKFCSRECADLGRTREAVERVCPQCDMTFTVPPFRIAQGVGKFCSTACRDAARRGVPNLDARKPANTQCETCGAEYRIAPGALDVGLGRFCSLPCKWEGETTRVTIPDDERDLIYMAALVDGEGTITARQTTSPVTGREAIHCRVIVANSYAPLMTWLSDAFGGKLSEPRTTRSIKHKPVMTWYVGSSEAIRLCVRLLPYLKVKRRQAEIVIALGKLSYTYVPGQRGRFVSPEIRASRAPLLDEIRALNHRGLVIN